MIHGLNHSEQVRDFGLAIARENGANPDFVRAFAVLHDSRRVNDSADPEHGIRAANWARENRGEFQLTDPLFEKLLFCCAYHNCGLISSDVEIGTCWDADRLDLSRVGIVPDVRYLSTDTAKQMLAKRVYKVTDLNCRSSHGDVSWGRGVTHRREEDPTAPPDPHFDIRSQREPGMLYAFKHPLIAAMFAPAYVPPIGTSGIDRLGRQFRLWEAEGEGIKDFGAELTCSALTTIREIPLPSVTPEQCVRFGILCALARSQSLLFSLWAESWLTGHNRSPEMAASICSATRKDASACETASAARRIAQAEYWAAYSAYLIARTEGRPATWELYVVQNSAGLFATAGAGLMAEMFPGEIDLVHLAKLACEWDRLPLAMVRAAACA